MSSSSPSPQSPHWLDTVVDNILTWQKNQSLRQLHVDDMKTPSGRVHTGALRGVVLHDLVAQELEKRGASPVSTYVFNDMDSMDGLPTYLDKATYGPHMGKPLYKIPAPPLDKCGINLETASQAEITELESAQNFAELYALDFMHAFRKLGCQQQLVWSHDLYESGQMDEAIKIALDSIDTIRTIYQEVADYQLPERWYPFQPICPQCGKVGTTLVTAWDGEQVTFECLPNKVTWAVGCGYNGRVSPFGGTGKLLWKVDWPAHWTVMGVNVEGAGKDHTSAGGSRDMANALIDQVFHKTQPFDIPYEWIMIRGAKMSSSKGVGTSAREFVELFSTEIGRFLFVSHYYGQVIDFDPQTMAIPDLFDAYDESARIFWQQVAGDKRLGRSFELSQVSAISEPHYLPRFRDVAVWMQHPEIDLEAKCAEVKGAALTELEKSVLVQRQHYARIWVERYAPEEYRLTPRLEMPVVTEKLTPEQRAYLQAVLTLINSNAEWQPADLQQALFELAKNSLGARPGFEAIYLAFLGKKSGPRAAWFLLAMDKALLTDRITSINQTHETRSDSTISVSTSTTGFISEEVRTAFPGIFFAQLRIDNVRIDKSDDDLDRLKIEIVDKLKDLTIEEIGAQAPIQAYRKLFKATGTDFHKKRPSPEALLRRIATQKGLYTINTAVDAYNLSVIETGVGLGGFNADHLKLPITLRFSHEGEEMLLLGDETVTTTREGQLVYADAERPVTIDLNYRDIADTKISEETTSILLYADGAPGLDQAEVMAALVKGAEYIQQFCGGQIGEAEIIS